MNNFSRFSIIVYCETELRFFCSRKMSIWFLDFIIIWIAYLWFENRRFFNYALMISSSILCIAWFFHMKFALSKWNILMKKMQKRNECIVCTFDEFFQINLKFIDINFQVQSIQFCHDQLKKQKKNSLLISFSNSRIFFRWSRHFVCWILLMNFWF